MKNNNYSRIFFSCSAPYTQQPQQHRHNGGPAKAEPDMDAFRIFDLPYDFVIDPKALHNAYRNHMMKLHPDRNSQKHPDEQQRLEQQASAVTAAYDILKKPHERARHLLKMFGHGLDEEESTVVDPEFLMEIMEIREDVENKPAEALQPLYIENEWRTQECMRQLAQAFQAEDWKAAKTLTAQLQYWNRIHEALLEKMDRFQESS
jgi:molecular chaperone HscB